jgi:hypothetical protein
MSDIADKIYAATGLTLNAEAAAAIERLIQAENEKLREVLEKLARLGAEPHYGNSVGNIIARAALGEKQ